MLEGKSELGVGTVRAVHLPVVRCADCEHHAPFRLQHSEISEVLRGLCVYPENSYTAST